MSTSLLIRYAAWMPPFEPTAEATVTPAEIQAMPDEQLVLRAQHGLQLAYTVLAERYWQKLLRYVRRILPNTNEAEDIVQDVLLKAYTNLNGFDTHRRFSPWIYRIAHNTIVDHAKTLGRRPLPFFDPEILFPHPIAKERPDTEADLASIRQLLETHLDRLPTKYREPLVLRYQEELSYRDIADILHLPTGTVSIRIKRGLAILRTTITPELV